MSSVVVVFFALCAVVQGFFDYSEIEDPLSIFWSTKNVLLRDNLNACTSTLQDGTIVQGSCKNPAECKLTKGLPLPKGSCPGFLTSCCYHARSCGKATRSKLSYFTSGSDAITTRECNYRVHINNENICQIRLDFERMNLEQPILLNEAITCSYDKFFVTPNPNSIPPICGFNNGQHVYITVNEGTKLVTLTMSLAERTHGGSRFVPPEWRIKVRQLECPKVSSNFLDQFSYDQLVADYKLIAPNYTVQHFVERTGYIRTFGFDEKLVSNKYVNGQSYSISFRRTRDVCGIRFTRKFFHLLYKTERESPEPYDTYCYDYLFVPGIQQFQNSGEPPFIAKVCGDESTDIDVTAMPPGPIYIFFHSGPTYQGNPAELDTNNEGFKLKYELLTC